MILSPNDSYLYEKIIHQVEEEQTSGVRKVLPVLVQAGVGAAAGTAIGFFFLPTISLVACGVVGGLGFYTATNTIQSIRNAWSSTDPLTVATPITSKSPIISSKQKD